MKILANDGLVEEGIQYLHKEGFEVDTVKRDIDDLIGDIKDFDALLVRSATKVTREVIEAGTKNGGKLKVVGRGGVGTDNIDLVAARENGVIVKFAPNGNTNATAEHALGLMLGVARKVPFAHATLKGGTWHKKRFQGVELMGKTLGIIGCGRIGQTIAKACYDSFGMKIVGYDEFLPPAVQKSLSSWIEFVDLGELCRRSDLITMHVPLTDGTRNLINAERLSLMKKDAVIVNTSRGGVIDEVALAAALKAGKLGGAGLDVFDDEPPKADNPLLDCDNALLTPHAAALTTECVVRMAVAGSQRVIDMAAGFNPGNIANPEVLSLERWKGLKAKN